jgi:hypothetical protein
MHPSASICVRREAPVCVICVSLFLKRTGRDARLPNFDLLSRKESVFDGERLPLATRYSLCSATDGGTRDARSAGT